MQKKSFKDWMIDETVPRVTDTSPEVFLPIYWEDVGETPIPRPDAKLDGVLLYKVPKNALLRALGQTIPEALINLLEARR